MHVPMKHRSIVLNLLAWFRKSARDLPWRRTKDPYGIWVSEVMLQQTQVKTVIPYWERWMRELPTIQALAKAKSEKIHKLWEGLGYYSRVRNLQRAAQIIVDRHQGIVPADPEQLLSLPGVGRYTAGAICSIAFDQPTPVLDGNVIRVLTRLVGIDGNPRERPTNDSLWDLSEKMVRQATNLGRAQRIERPASTFNQALMELGALICTSRQPVCTACPVAKNCVALREDRVEELPANSRRVPTTQRRFAAFVVGRKGKWLVRQRPAGVVNGYLWEFPNVETSNSRLKLEQAARLALGFTPNSMVPMLSFRHSITRYRITLDVFHTSPKPARFLKQCQGNWLTLDDLNALPFTGSHRKILTLLHPD